MALVHDWLVTWRGGERVLAVLHQIWPQAPVYTLIADPSLLALHLPGVQIRPSPLQVWPGARRYFRWLLPWFPYWVERWDLSGYDLIVSSSHCVAKGVIPDPDTLHVCYIHTPMRYVWDRRFDYWGHGIRYRLLEYAFLHRLRRWDTASAPRVDLFVANSRFVARRVRKYYGRSALVLHPPIRTDFFQPADGTPEHFLIVSALVPYKRVEVAVEAFRAFPRVPLVVVGDGPLRRALQRRAPPNVRWLGRVDDEELRMLYQRAYAVLLLAVEDFGMVVAEAHACGRPAIVGPRGGALEVIEPDVTGIVLPEVSVPALQAAIDRVLTARFNKDVIRARVESLGEAAFAQRFRSLIQWAWTRFRVGRGLDEELRLLDRFPQVVD
ncbi:MAG: glycosyltransferase [Acidobacteria bacterium]|nr:glycosyltransferase [Acidobacteriota bacterium]MDW7985398.1 glycosyltransferase [Acidobacteriota bacterium]